MVLWTHPISLTSQRNFHLSSLFRLIICLGNRQELFACKIEILLEKRNHCTRERSLTLATTGRQL